jgi:hypothetical protein
MPTKRMRVKHLLVAILITASFVSVPHYLRVYNQYGPLWNLLDKEASKLRNRNYERIFDEARSRVRAWEKAHSKGL